MNKITQPFSKTIIVIHGPNLNLLGTREVLVYGEKSLEEINISIQNKALFLGEKYNTEIKVQCRQSNSESEIIGHIHNARESKYHGLIINPAAYTHTSIAIRDAIVGIQIPAIEVHLSNVYKREEFRHHSYIAPVCLGQISGLGSIGYELALEAIVSFTLQLHE